LDARVPSFGLGDALEKVRSDQQPGRQSENFSRPRIGENDASIRRRDNQSVFDRMQSAFNESGAGEQSPIERAQRPRLPSGASRPPPGARRRGDLGLSLSPRDGV